MGQIKVRGGGYRSLFWPIVLIGIGVIWLLGNLNIIGVENFVVVARLWPILLIVVGLDLLFGRTSPVLGALLAIGVVALLVVLMLVGPSIGLGYNIEPVEMAESEPIGDALSANIVLQIASGTLNINPLKDSKDLIDFDIKTVGEVQYDVTGGSSKVVTLKQAEWGGFDGFVNLIVGMFDDEQDRRWDVGLSPDVPLDLDIDNATGSVSLDLSGLKLTNLRVSLGTGVIDLTLPQMEAAYAVHVSSGTGSGDITIPEPTDLNLDVESGTGSYTIDVPDGAAVRIVANTGTGAITVPSGFKKVGGDDNNIVGDSGTWESENFADSSRQIVIMYNGGTGGLTVR